MTMIPNSTSTHTHTHTHTHTAELTYLRIVSSEEQWVCAIYVNSWMWHSMHTQQATAVSELPQPHRSPIKIFNHFLFAHFNSGHGEWAGCCWVMVPSLVHAFIHQPATATSHPARQPGRQAGSQGDETEDTQNHSITTLNYSEQGPFVVQMKIYKKT